MPNLYQVSLKGILPNRDRILIVKGPITTGELFWDLPGGRMEKGETVEQALIREVGEELPGLASPKIIELLHATADRHLTGGKDLLTLFYLMEADLPEVRLSDEHVEHRWVTAAEVKTIKQTTGSDFFAGFAAALRLAFSKIQ